MDEIMTVRRLKKHYPGFELDVSFGLQKGKITGFIGRNGAGKTTALKALLSLVHPDGGEIRFFGLDFKTHEREIKQKIGYVPGGFDFYPRKKLAAITAATKAFYPEWSDSAYSGYMEKFGLDGGKTPLQLSAGMRVKYALALALSHGAELLLLDEPTSGIDPVSREELIDIFLELADEGKTVFFSTHVTSDLDKCADDIVYIRKGRIAAEGSLKKFLSAYLLAELPFGRFETLSEEEKRGLIGAKRSKDGFTAVVSADRREKYAKLAKLSPANLESLMVHFDSEAYAARKSEVKTEKREGQV